MKAVTLYGPNGPETHFVDDEREAAISAAKERVVEAALEYDRLDQDRGNSDQDWREWHAAYEGFSEAVAALRALLDGGKV